VERSRTSLVRVVDIGTGPDQRFNVLRPVPTMWSRCRPMERRAATPGFRADFRTGLE
jgi:hypothetical protein